MVDVYVN